MAEDVKRKISIFINDREVKDSLGGIGREIGKIKRELKETSDPAERKRLNAELQNTRKRYGEIKNEIEETNISLDEARGHFSNLVSGLVSGDIKLIQSGLQGIVGNLKGMTKAALAFIATPIGLAITALSAIGLAAKKWFDFNAQVFETNKLVKELTNETGSAVDDIRIRAEVLRDTFEIDLNESIKSAKTLVNGFGVSYDEAFNLIEASAVRGKTKNEEFFASLKEYPVQFKNAGFSAKDFVNIINTGVDLSIYSDKLPDAIKEFTLSVTEQTPAAKTALENAFGAKFTNTLFNNLKTGAITSKDALQLISKEAETIGLNSQQAQLLTTDLFKGSGEDAGGALKIFEAVNIALSDQQKPLTENQTLTAKQLELNKELQGVYTQLFASGNSAFQNLIAKGKIFATETLLKILKGGVDVYNWFVDLNNESGLFSAVLSSIGSIASTSFKIIGSLLTNAVTGFKGLGTIIEGIFTLDTDKIASGFKTAVSALPNLVKDIKNEVVNDVNEIYDAFNGKNKAKKISLSDFTSGDGNATNPIDPKDPDNNVDEDLTPEDKKIIASKKKLAEFLKDFEEDQELQKELLKVDKEKRAEEEEVLRLEAKYQKLAEDAGFQTILEAGLLDAKNAELKIIRDNYDTLEIEAKKKKDAELLKLDEKQKQALLKAETDLENAKANLQSSGFALVQSFFGKKTAVYKLLFGLEKAMAINQVLVDASKSLASIASNTGIANMKAVAASPLTGGLPFIGINTAIGAKQALTTKISAGIQIANIAGSAIQGFYYGGNTGNKAMAYDNYGKITGVVHDDEWVMPKIMTQNPKYAANLAYLENERKLITKGYFNGGSVAVNNTGTTAIAPTTTENPLNNNADNVMLIEVLSKNNQFLEFLIANGVTAVFSNDLRTIDKLQDRLTDLQTFKDKNKP